MQRLNFGCMRWVWEEFYLKMKWVSNLCNSKKKPEEIKWKETKGEKEANAHSVKT